MTNKNFNNNGFNFVDLGLPSKTLWTTANVGASDPSDAGLYFQWGDVQGYKAEQVGVDKNFTWDEYKFSINGSGTNFTKYTNREAKLELKDDAANHYMGGDWHMPTIGQINELIENATNSLATMFGVEGKLFTSKKDKTKFIFIPAAGGALANSIGISGFNGYIWSSMLSFGRVGSAKYLSFNDKEIYNDYCNVRCFGFPVRGVIG